MRVKAEIGPVSGTSARAWLATAANTIEHLARTPALGVPVHVVDAFRSYWREWSQAADGAESFHWHGEVDTTSLRELAAHWVRLVNLAREDPAGTGLRTAPPEAEAFFDALAATMATALEHDADPEEFAEKFEQLVPDFLDGARRRVPAESPIRVLLVDDTPDVRMLVRLALDLDGRFEVTGEAGDGAAALDVCEGGGCPDVVLLDLSMPVLDGLTALPRLRKLCPHAAVVMFSADCEPENLQRASDLGAAAFLPKYASIKEIVDVLAQAAS